MAISNWEFLGTLCNKVRVEIVKALLELEFRSLSEITERLAEQGHKMTLSGVIKHMRELEALGLVRHESGAFSSKPDARKTIYFLEGKERVEQLLKDLQNDVLAPLQAGIIFSRTAQLARRVQKINRKLLLEDRSLLESLLVQCELTNVFRYLTLDEKKKIKLWKLMMEIV